MIEKICLRQGLGWHGCDSTSKPEIEKQSQFKLDIQTVLFKYLDISIGRFHIQTNFYVCSSPLIAHPLRVLLNISRVIGISSWVTRQVPGIPCAGLDSSLNRRAWRKSPFLHRQRQSLATPYTCGDNGWSPRPPWVAGVQSGTCNRAAKQLTNRVNFDNPTICPVGR